MRAFFLFFTLFLVSPCFLLAQTEVDERAVISFDKGLGFFAPDSTFGLNLRFRMQNRIGMTTVSSTDLSPESFEANVRRLRLRFDGFLGTKFTYYLQLSFSRGDQDWDVSQFPGVLRDAMIFYTFNERFYIGFGQGKLPGNRQRVVSSGQQQFVDRSLVNALFNIDRDFGLMFYHMHNLGIFDYNLKGAISSGEGRNIMNTDDGLAYTARIELLPLGRFENDGDFSEGDLEGESSPKISIGATYSINHKAKRHAGQRGYVLPEQVDIRSVFFDFVFKYSGWAVQGEYASREVPLQPWLSPTEANQLYIFTGKGLNSQLSYVFPGYVELAARHTWVIPHEEINAWEPVTHIYTIGATKYYYKHRNKIQLNLSYNDRNTSFSSEANNWLLTFQIELGI